jgi:hypothetical protein
VGAGESLKATATVSGNVLAVQVGDTQGRTLSGVSVSDVTYGRLLAVTQAGSAGVTTITFDLSPDADGGSDGGATDAGASDAGAGDGGAPGPAGFFTLDGTLNGFSASEHCTVRRTFHFSVLPAGTVIVSMRDDALPLGARQEAKIALVSRDGLSVRLQARTAFPGACRASWDVTAGEIVAGEAAEICWRLPAEPGLYQAELVVDYGDAGLAFDTLVVEVA